MVIEVKEEIVADVQALAIVRNSRRWREHNETNWLKLGQLTA